MRFGNSSNYFGLRIQYRRPVTLNSATGKAFHAFNAGISSPSLQPSCARPLLRPGQQCTRHLFQGHQPRLLKATLPSAVSQFGFHNTDVRPASSGSPAFFTSGPRDLPRAHSRPLKLSHYPAKRLFLEILRFVIQTHVKWTRLRQPRLATTSSAPSAAGAWSRSSSTPSSAAESSACPPPWPRSSATTARTPYSRPASA